MRQRHTVRRRLSLVPHKDGHHAIALFSEMTTDDLVPAPDLGIVGFRNASVKVTPEFLQDAVDAEGFLMAELGREAK